MDYFAILKRSFQITWQHKSMWFYGFLLALFSGGGGNFSSNYSSNQQDFGKFAKSTSFPKLPHISDDVLIIIIIVAVLALLFFIALSIFFSSLSQAALIGMVEDVESEGKTGISSGWRHGLASWWQIFVIGFLIGLPAFLAVLLLGGLAVGPGIFALIAKKEVLGIVLIIIGVVVLIGIIILIAIPAGLVTTLACRFRVLEKKSSVESIKEGWHLFRSNLGPVLLMWLIMLVVGFAVGMAIAIISFFVAIPLILAALVNILLMILLAIPFVLALGFLQGVVQVFTQSVWTLFYKELTKPKVAPA